MPPLVEQTLERFKNGTNRRRVALSDTVQGLARQATGEPQKRDQLIAVLSEISVLEKKEQWVQGVLDYALRTRKIMGVSDLEEEDIVGEQLTPPIEKLAEVPQKVTRGRERFIILDKPVEIKSKRQAPILRYLLEKTGRLAPRKELAERAYGKANQDTYQKVRNDVMDIRCALEKAAVNVKIETKKRKGYKLLLTRVAEKTEAKPVRLTPLVDAAKKTGFKESTVRTLVKSGNKNFKEGTHFVKEKHGQRIYTSVTDEGLKLLLILKPFAKGKEKIYPQTLFKALAEKSKPKDQYHYRQVRMNAPKAAKLADRLASLPLDIEAKYGIQIPSEKRTLYHALWSRFCSTINEEAKAELDFPGKVIPKLETDLLAFSANPVSALKFLNERAAEKKIVDYGAVPELSIVVEDILFTLEKIDPKARKQFVTDLLQHKGLLVRQNGWSEPVEKAK